MREEERDREGDMYAQAGFIHPFMPQGTPENQHDDFFPAVEDDLIYTFLSSAALELDDIIPMPTIPEYDLGAAGDLFKDPKPILGEPVLALDPVADAMPMMSDDGSMMMSAETTEADSLSSVPDKDLLTEEFYKCKRELIAVSAILESPSPGASEVEAVAAADRNVLAVEGPLQRSVSFGCTSSAIPDNGRDARPTLLGFRQMNLENTYVMRSHGRGDMKTFASSCSVFGDMNMAPSFKLLSAFRDIKIEDRIEERRLKIFRYQKKKTKRNFGRKIKYACRKALADSQPRVRGRFARADRQANAEDSEEHEVGKKCLDL